MQGYAIEVLRRPCDLNEDSDFLKSPNWTEFNKHFYDNYDQIYNDDELEMSWYDLVDEFDRLMGEEKFKQFVVDFAENRGDMVSSDRECEAFCLTCLDLTAKEEKAGTKFQVLKKAWK